MTHARLSPYEQRQKLIEDAVLDLLDRLDGGEPVMMASVDIVAELRRRDVGFLAVSYYDINRLMNRLQGDGVVRSEQRQRLHENGRLKRCSHWGLACWGAR